MNRKMIKKAAAFLSIAAILSCSFLSCGSTNDTKDNGSNAGPSLSPTGGSDAGNDSGTSESPMGTTDATDNAGASDNTGTSDNAGNAGNAGTSDNAAGDTTGGAITGAKAGTYTASAKGYASDVKVTVTVDDAGLIKKIDVDAAGETENIGQAAAPQIADQVVETQSLNVDSVSGATYTSTATMTAIKDALKQAGVDSTAVTQ